MVRIMEFSAIQGSASVPANAKPSLDEQTTHEPSIRPMKR
jgi:hypothetical protein